MSQLSQLKNEVQSLSQDAKSTARALGTFKAKFSKSVGQVSATVGGSSQQVDKKMIETFKSAEDQVDKAIAALQQAASAASGYAQGL